MSNRESAQQVPHSTYTLENPSAPHTHIYIVLWSSQSALCGGYIVCICVMHRGNGIKHNVLHVYVGWNSVPWKRTITTERKKHTQQNYREENKRKQPKTYAPHARTDSHHTTYGIGVHRALQVYTQRQRETHSTASKRNIPCWLRGMQQAAAADSLFARDLITCESRETIRTDSNWTSYGTEAPNRFVCCLKTSLEKNKIGRQKHTHFERYI